MHAAAYPIPVTPAWQQGVRRRLALCLTVSTLLVACILLVLGLPAARVLTPPPEFVLRLVPRVVEPPHELRPATERTTDVRVQERAPARRDATKDPAPAPAPAQGSVPRDWYGDIEAATKHALDEAERIISVNPALEAKRREAAGAFRPSSGAVRSPEIWDSVETDQLGRKVLVQGDCYRVIDDTSAANYEVFRAFQQYLVHCVAVVSETQELPWARTIRERYQYLQKPDGEIRPEVLR